jgi:hypothetical protein
MYMHLSPTCFGHLFGHIQGDENMNTNKIIMCRHLRDPDYKNTIEKILKSKAVN